MRVTKRRAQTRAKMLTEARQVFCDKGFGHVTVDDVCEAAGFTRGAFYSQFANLDELFFVLYEQWATATAEHMRDAVNRSQPGADMHAVIDLIVDNLSLDRAWLTVKLDFLLHASRDPQLAARYEFHRDQLCTVIKDLLSRSGRDGAFGSHAETARAVVAAYDSIATSVVLDGDEGGARRRLLQTLTAFASPPERRPRVGAPC